MLKARKPSAILLDLAQEETAGLEACSTIKSDPELANIPILFLSSRVSAEDINSALERGAADYLTKPIAPKLLMTRLQAVLRGGANGITHLGDADSLRLDIATKIAEAGGKKVELTEMEFNILRFLMEHPGLVYTPYQISQELRSELLRYVNPRLVEKDVYDLRNKLAVAGDYLENVVGVGIRFCEE